MRNVLAICWKNGVQKYGSTDGSRGTEPDRTGRGWAGGPEQSHTMPGTYRSETALVRGATLTGVEHPVGEQDSTEGLRKRTKSLLSFSAPHVRFLEGTWFVSEGGKEDTSFLEDTNP